MYGVVIGKIGKIEPKELNDNFVLQISVAETKYIKGEEVSTWYSCSYWGKRAKSISDHLFVGQSVSVVGQSYNEKYNDKLYLKMHADNIIMQSYKDKNDNQNNIAKGNNSQNTTGWGDSGVQDEWG